LKVKFRGQTAGCQVAMAGCSDVMIIQTAAQTRRKAQDLSSAADVLATRFCPKLYTSEQYLGYLTFLETYSSLTSII
jgi:hypothetical protein